MLIFDQLKKDDPKLRVVAIGILAAFAVLLAGLWWVQIVSAREYQASLETQSFRSVRIPAVRGKILDRNGLALAENQPAYNVSLYLEELRKQFDAAYAREATRLRAELSRQMADQQKKLGRKLTRQERRAYTLTAAQRNLLRKNAKFEVASNVVAQVSRGLGEALVLDRAKFERHYETRLALPYPIVSNLDATNIARFEERLANGWGIDLEVQSTRVYPFQSLAAHVLGRLQRDDRSLEGEDAFFSYRLPDFRGIVGIEYAYDKELRGQAGAKSVLVNNLGYRQSENIWSPADPGDSVVLTIDAAVQQAAEKALRAVRGPNTRAAAVVMDVHSGDILAMASSPTLNPNLFVLPQGPPPEEWRRITETQAEKNRATHERYPPGSIFKIVTGLACLEAGLNPDEQFGIRPDPDRPDRGAVFVGRRKIKDTAPPGDYDFRRALKLSCNSYFITNALRVGPEPIIRLGLKFCLGQGTGLNTRQESAGAFPSLERLSSGWVDGNTANMSIGQDPVLVTPLQVAVLLCAVANGGTVLWPRIIDRIEPQDPTSGIPATMMPKPRIRGQLGVSPRSLQIVQNAMLADTEDPDGTGRHVRDSAPLTGLRICAKTGTAEVQDVQNRNTGKITWYGSFAPYGAPKYAVVVMVEDGESGGKTCGPPAGKIYAALLERERVGPAKHDTLAKVK